MSEELKENIENSIKGMAPVLGEAFKLADPEKNVVVVVPVVVVVSHNMFENKLKNDS